MTAAAWAGFVLAVGLSGMLRGFAGFGFSMAAVPLLSLVMPPAQAIPVTVLLQVAISLAGLRDAVRVADRRSVALMAAGAAVGAPLGVAVLARLDAGQARLAIAVLLLAAIALLGRGFRFRRPLRTPGVVAVGIAAGLANGLTGVPGPPVVAYYVASPVTAAVARASMIVLFLFTSLLAGASLAVAGLLTWEEAAPVAAGVPLVFAGSWAGEALFRHHGGRHYHRVALGVLTATALAALGKALPGL